MKYIKWCIFLSGPLFFLLLTFQSCNNKNALDLKFQPVLKQEFQAVSDLLNEYVSQEEISGGVALVHSKGEMVLHIPFGMSDIEKEKSMELNDIFRIASMTKQITSVAAMMLYEDGKFELDDPVAKYLPEFTDMQVLERINRTDSTFIGRPANQTMTIKQLFTFTSGLYYGYDIDSLSILFNKAGITEGFEERDISLEQNIKNLAKMPLLHEPGERYHYGLEMDLLPE